MEKKSLLEEKYNIIILTTHGDDIDERSESENERDTHREREVMERW